MRRSTSQLTFSYQAIETGRPITIAPRTNVTTHNTAQLLVPNHCDYPSRREPPPDQLEPSQRDTPNPYFTVLSVTNRPIATNPTVTHLIATVLAPPPPPIGTRRPRTKHTNPYQAHETNRSRPHLSSATTQFMPSPDIPCHRDKPSHHRTGQPVPIRLDVPLQDETKQTGPSPSDLPSQLVPHPSEPMRQANSCHTHPSLCDKPIRATPARSGATCRYKTKRNKPVQTPPMRRPETDKTGPSPSDNPSPVVSGHSYPLRQAEPMLHYLRHPTPSRRDTTPHTKSPRAKATSRNQTDRSAAPRAQMTGLHRPRNSRYTPLRPNATRQNMPSQSGATCRARP
jgi:hypothetical protein